MKIIRYELLKLLKYPLMWGLLVLFIGFNIFVIWNEVGSDDIQTALRAMYNVMINGETDSIYAEDYQAYKEGYAHEYDTLDMQKIKQMKERITFKPTGSYKKFIDNNYDKLQKRVEQIKSDGDTNGDFYPGDLFKIHGKLYSLIKRCIIQMMIMMCFSVLYLMDFERINRTEDLVFSSRIGRVIMRKKRIAGLIGGLLFCVFILVFSLEAFLVFVPMKGLWETPVSSVMVMESSGLWEYPFITFVRLNIGQELMLTLLTAILLTGLCGMIAGALQLFVNNSYITMISIGAGSIGLLAIPYAIKSTGWLKTVVCLSPTGLLFYCGRWFIENDIMVSFAWSEYLTLGIWFFITAIVMILGNHHLKTKDF